MAGALDLSGIIQTVSGDDVALFDLQSVSAWFAAFRWISDRFSVFYQAEFYTAVMYILENLTEPMAHLIGIVRHFQGFMGHSFKMHSNN